MIQKALSGFFSAAPLPVPVNPHAQAIVEGLREVDRVLAWLVPKACCANKAALIKAIDRLKAVQAGVFTWDAATQKDAE